MKYIYSHLGLGDHVICNGLYRELIKQDEVYTIFVKHHNIETVSFMLRDLDNIIIKGVNDDKEVRTLINFLGYDNFIIIGFNNYRKIGAKDFDDGFYLQHNINFDKRWTSFKCDRDLEKEVNIFNKFNVKEGEYVFLHDDHTRGYEINENLIINKDLEIIRPILGYTKNSFDYSYLMQHSKESHFIDSSFRLIFDSLQLRNDNIFFHVNLKHNVTRGYMPDSKLDFKII